MVGRPEARFLDPLLHRASFTQPVPDSCSQDQGPSLQQLRLTVLKGDIRTALLAGHYTANPHSTPTMTSGFSYPTVVHGLLHFREMRFIQQESGWKMPGHSVSI